MKNTESGVRAWEGEISIPTYLLGPEDKNPPILTGRKNPIHPGSSIIYPYPMQENLTNIREDRIWKALLLENDYLRLTLLPELGGRLLSVFDKISEEEALYRNHVLKFARIGIRGAWVSGGIEWNFPNGHTVTTSSPIDYTIRENENGSKTIIVGDIERVSRMKWSVGITLYPNQALFETEIRLFNRTFLPNRFWFWANSAAPASPGLEFITTATKVMTLKDVMNFPIHNDVDLRWDRNHMEPQDLFSLNPTHDFVAWYNHDLDRGMINYADRFEVKGRKFYTWGNSDDGKIWTDLLTDEDGPYSEMQSGRLPTMCIWEILQPYSVESWKEAWYPIRKIGSPLFANREAAFFLDHLKEKNKIRLGVHVTSLQPGAEISLSSGNTTLWSEKKDLEPARPYIAEISPQGKKNKYKEMKLTLTNGRGEILAEYLKEDESRFETGIMGYYKIEPSPKTLKAEELWKSGIDYEKTGDFTMAEEQYEHAVMDDPDFSPAHRSLGILYLRRGNYDRAVSEFNHALRRNPSDEGARFFLGSCFMIKEQFYKAVEELRTLARSQKYGAASSYLLGGLHLGLGEIDAAIQQLQKSSRHYSENLDGQALLACAYRKKGQFSEANSIVTAILKKDPLNFLAYAEGYFIAEAGENQDVAIEKKKTLKNILRDEPQSYLELATDHARFGLYDEGIRVLSLFIEDRKQSEDLYPLIYYYLGYYYDKIGEKEKALEYKKLGGKMNHSFVFPHRLESEMVLRSVLRLIPGDGKAMYYLGNLLCAKGRTLEAIKFWHKAAQKVKNLSEIHRNLGRAYWRALDEPDRSVEEYETALKCDPDDYKLYYELDSLYAAAGLTEKRKALLNKVSDRLMENDMIAERAANLCTDTGEYDRSLEILLNTHFFPWEAYTEGRRIYEDTNIGRGAALMKAGKYKEALECFKAFMKYPRNIGVGEPARKSHAEALFRLGLAFEKMGEVEKAKKFWEKAAEEEHSEWNALRYFEARSLQCLGRKKEADSLLNGLQNYAENNIKQGYGNEADNLYLLGLSYKGKGEKIKALSYFKRALALNGTHRRCSWELNGILD